MPPRPNPLVQSLPATIPFIAPERIERDRNAPFAARLGANEGNFGPSPAASEAMARAARDEAWKYCDPENWALRERLSAHLGIDMEEIVAGPGIDGLLGLTVRIFSDTGQPILSSLGAYPTFNYHIAGYGRQLVTVPYAGVQEDLEALAARCREIEPAIVYISNPDNPMGSWWDAGAITRFCEVAPEQTLILLDEAYGETAPERALPAIDTARPNLIRMRTFSKAYGMAGMRCGYAFGHRDLIAAFDKVRDHFGVNILAQAGARAALDDGLWLEQTLGHIADARETIAAIGARNGLNAVPSATNFVTLDCGHDGDFALTLLKALEARGVFVRKPMAPGLDRHIRVSAGRSDELDWFAEQLPGALAEAKGEPAG